MITVIGASGGVGRAVVERLCHEQERCRAVTRSATRVPHHPAVEVFEGELADPTFLAATLEGSAGLFVVQVGDLDVEAVVREAERAGVRRVAAVSSMLVDSHPDSMIGAGLRAFEDTLGSLRGTVGFVRPWEFASNTVEWAEGIRRDGRVVVPEFGRPSPVVDPRDVADVAVDLLLDRALAGGIHTLAGPSALGVQEKVDVIAAELGRRLSVRVDDAWHEDIHRSAPDPVVAALSVPGVSGLEPPTRCPTVLDVRGVPARTFAQWVRDHIDNFQGAGTKNDDAVPQSQS